MAKVVWFDIPVSASCDRVLLVGHRIARTETAGGRILVPKTPIGDAQGVFAYFEDSEGNRVGLHAPA